MRIFLSTEKVSHVSMDLSTKQLRPFNMDVNGLNQPGILLSHPKHVGSMVAMFRCVWPFGGYLVSADVQGQVM